MGIFRKSYVERLKDMIDVSNELAELSNSFNRSVFNLSKKNSEYTQQLKEESIGLRLLSSMILDKLTEKEKLNFSLSIDRIVELHHYFNDVNENTLQLQKDLIEKMEKNRMQHNKICKFWYNG